MERVTVEWDELAMVLRTVCPMIEEESGFVSLRFETERGSERLWVSALEAGDDQWVSFSTPIGRGDETDAKEAVLAAAPYAFGESSATGACSA